MRKALLALLAVAACGEVPDTPIVDAPVAVDAAEAPNLIMNGDFADGTLHWTPVDTTLAIVNGGLELRQATTGGPGLAWQMVFLTPGATYQLSATFVAGSYPRSYHIRVGTQTNDATFATYGEGASTTFTLPTDAGPGVWVTLNNVSAQVDEYAIFDDVRLTAAP
ncbi:MAG: carbohydrate binding domain-containing protein [Myxococcales bacterium]|nr:carbohydrate binding domain-containing protein [Myxococcales bacterium]